jgi:hypothetical protein
MDFDLFLVLFYIAALQVVTLVGLIYVFSKKFPLASRQVEQPNPEKVRVMVHFENGEVHLKDGVIIQGNMWKALAGKETAYVQANGNKYLIAPKSFRDDLFHVMDTAKVKVTPQETQPTKQGLSSKEVADLYERWKDLPPEQVAKLFDDYMKQHAEVKHRDK